VELREDLETAAARELREETGVRDVPLVQVKTFGAWDRDPRWRVITTLYAAELPEKPAAKAGDDAADARWFSWSLEETPLEEGVAALRLTLRSEELQFSVKATRLRRGSGRLWESRYTDYEADGLAADHGLMILEAISRVYGQN
jgi:8-oxo-dGTP diphosphatase